MLEGNCTSRGETVGNVTCSSKSGHVVLML